MENQNPFELKSEMYFGIRALVALGTVMVLFGATGTVEASKIRNTSISGGEAAYLESYTGPLKDAGAGARALLVRASDGTTVTTVSAWGLAANSTYNAHVHSLPCDLNAGPHYQNDPNGPVDDVNEIWPSFTTDSDGVGGAQVTSNYSVRPDAMSAVIHDTPNAASGSGAKMLCANLNRGAQGAVVNRGSFEPFAAAASIDENIGGTGSIAVSANGTTIVVADVYGLDPNEAYRSHVHALPCDVNEAGPHYKILPEEPAVLEANELWLDIIPNSSGDAYFRASFDTIARPDAQSIVIHRCSVIT